MTDFNTYVEATEELMEDLDERITEQWHRMNVTEPFHYKNANVEAIAVIESVLTKAGLTPAESWRLGNVLKYALRAGHKGEAGDLDRGFDLDTSKAANYAHRLVSDEWLEA